jgi:hypothetical protein
MDRLNRLSRMHKKLPPKSAGRTRGIELNNVGYIETVQDTQIHVKFKSTPSRLERLSCLLTPGNFTVEFYASKP